KLFDVVEVLAHAGLFAVRIELKQLAAVLAPIESAEQAMHHDTVIKNFVDQVMHRSEIVLDEIGNLRRLFPAPGTLDQIRQEILDFHPEDISSSTPVGIRLMNS